MKSPWSPEEVSKFLEHYFYSPEAFMISEVRSADPSTATIEAAVNPGAKLLVSSHQTAPERWYPRHVSAADMIMLTVSMGSLHAYFFHGCRWDEGWVGYGNRIENAKFESMGNLKEPLVLVSKEIRTRRGSKRVLLDMEFAFFQGSRLVYTSRQTALFVKNTN